MCKLFRIYTSDLNRRAVLRLAADKFQNFTFHSATGFDRGTLEESMVIEIVNSREEDVEELAQSIREINGQKPVLVMSLHANAQKVDLTYGSAEVL